MQALKFLGGSVFLALVLAGLALCPVAGARSLAVSDEPFVFVLRILSTDHYQVEVQDTSGTTFIKGFDWVPPSGVTVVAVTGAQGGTCKLDGSGGISCTGKALPATCVGCAGSSMLVNFTATGREPTFANGFWTYYGVEGGVQITGTIPVQKPSFGDLPLCKKGQTSTKAHRCSKS